MPIFEYKAYAQGGAVQSGVIDADTPREARIRLRKENLLVSEFFDKRRGRSVKQRAGGAKVGMLEKMRR